MQFDRRTLGAEATRIVRELAQCSEPGPGVTRLYLTPEHRRAIELLSAEMRKVGLEPKLDAAATLRGHLAGPRPDSPVLLTGSHIDSVREGGAFDGALGAVLPIVAIGALRDAGHELPFAVEVLAFGDEEGVRFPATLTGSRAIAGTLAKGVLEGRDGEGRSLADALTAFGLDPQALSDCAANPQTLLGYLELHIEQGPVLEAERLPIGVVTAIASAARFEATLRGEAGHAGTVPMTQRRDALAGAAEAVLAVERLGRAQAEAVATVGRMEVRPAAPNVVPAEARFSLDLRATGESELAELVGGVEAALQGIAKGRDLQLALRPSHRARGCRMDQTLSARLATAIAAARLPCRRLPSGAGHDAMAIAAVTPVAMLFVRCRDGLSHHPDEFVEPADLGVATEVLLRFLLDPTPLAPRPQMPM